MNLDRFIGITESEGYFSCLFAKSKTGYKPQIMLRFGIKQTNAKDGLLKIKNFLKEMNIESKINKNEHDLYIQNFEELYKISEIFLNTEFVFKKKQKSFYLWNKILQKIKNKREKSTSLNIKDIKEIWSIKNKINPSGKGKTGLPFEHFFNENRKPRNGITI